MNMHKLTMISTRKAYFSTKLFMYALPIYLFLTVGFFFPIINMKIGYINIYYYFLAFCA